MQKTDKSAFTHFVIQNRRRRWWKRLVQVMACVVVFCTTYALILPAITMEKETQCGYTEHIHDINCYTKQTVELTTQSICTYEVLGVHEHTADCKDADNAYICGYADFIVHEHNSNCFDEAEELICRLPEVESHEHTTSCYSQVVGPETHVHDDSCYTVERGKLICEQTEVEGHTHSDGCSTQGGLICDTEETNGHTHDENCTVTELVCTLEFVPHEHGEDCYEQRVCPLVEHSHSENCSGSILTCQEQDETHTHGESCYEQQECTQSEHVHTEACNGDVLVCTASVDPHDHVDTCYQTTYSCGLDETAAHTHSRDCYTWTLTCTQEETSGHQHVEGCYAEEKKLTCGKEETSETVEIPEPELICKKAEIILHTHNGTCFAADANGNNHLVCGMVEIREHVHTETCQKTTETPAQDADTLTCDQEETDGHTHSQENGCYDEEGNLICQLPEKIAHSHSDMCYGTWNLVCEATEHTHGEECYPVEETTAETTAPTEAPVYYCGFEEHLHEDACFNLDGNQICQLEGHVHDEYCLEEASGENGGISTWALIPDTVVDSGTIANAEGVADAITWTVTQDSAGNYTLTVTGIGTIPDYVDETYTPWHAYGNAKYNVEIVLGDGITRVGQNAFKQFVVRSIDFGGVTSLAYRSFGYIHTTNGKSITITIPGTVKSIEAGAFQYSWAIENFILEEGIESIGNSAFLVQLKSDGPTITIPASVTYLHGGFCNFASEYVVTDGNENYCSVDGVIYSKDMTTLVDYPAFKKAEEYVIPESVTTVGPGGLSNVRNTRKLYVPNTVTSGVTSRCLEYSVFEEIYIEDGFAEAFNSFALHYVDNLISVRYPENTPVNFTGMTSYTTYDIKELKIPNKTVKIDQGGHLPVLEKVLYDAENAQIRGNVSFFTSCNPFQLTVGTNVNVLPAEFYRIVDRAGSIAFDGENYFTAAAGAFDTAFAPLTGLSGTFYVDAQGVLYHYDAETETATLVMVSPGAENVTIPATIPAENGTPCTVTTVKQDAFKFSDTSSLTIAGPENFTTIETNAFANCPTLTSVNDQTTVEEAEALFTNDNLVMGYGPFYNTGLGGSTNPENFGSEMNGSESLQLKSEDTLHMDIYVTSEADWSGNEDGTGGYTLLTGQSMSINISAGNTVGNTQNTYRVYLRRTRENCNLNVEPGKSYTFTDTTTDKTFTVNCLATEDPNTVCLEFTPGIGETVNFSVTAEYPSPSSPGGGLIIWGQIVFQEGSTAITEPTQQSIQAYWTTKPDSFKLRKEPSAAGSYAVGDKDGVLRPYTYIGWNIFTERTEDTISPYGKDYVTSIEYKDIMTLPEGVSWDPAVVEAIKDGDVSQNGINVYAGDIYIIKISDPYNKAMDAVSVTWDDALNTAIIHWVMKNPNDDAEIMLQEIRPLIQPEALVIDATKFATNEQKTITNRAEATIHYHYSEDKQISDEAQRTVRLTNGILSFTKVSSQANKTPYFAEDVTYTLTVSNGQSLPWTAGTAGAYMVEDTMSQYSYIKPENMKKMLDEAEGNLTITIENAQLATWIPVTDAYDGEGAYKTSGNSDLNSSSCTLTITGCSGNYSISIDGVISGTGSSLNELLKDAGYSVTALDKYKCVWKVSGENEYFTVSSGQALTYLVYATFKDTFQILGSDWPNSYQSPGEGTVSVKNTALLKDPSGNTVSGMNKSVSNTIKREAYVYKSVYRDGELLGSAPTAGDGQILDYRLDFKHYGNGICEDIPMVDDLYGSQYLLVPVAGNAAGLSSRIVTDDGVEYYVLMEGTYENVKVGIDDTGTLLVADTITVTKANGEQYVNLGGQQLSYTGLHTQIKWYFPEITGNWQTTVDYKAIVDMDAGASSTYTLGNIVWMNDRTNSRLYDPIWGGGTIIDFEKHIVTQKGTTPENDELTEYSLVGPGETVTYRLTLHNTANYPFTLMGERIADDLPDTHGVFDWIKNTNVNGVEIKLSSDDIEHSGLNNWSVSDSYTGLAGDNQQYIVWPEDAFIKFPDESTVYLYFTLTYPENTDGAPAWDQYAAAVNGNEIHNTLYVYHFPETVTHNLRETGEVLLQKGVFGMYHYNKADSAYPLPAGTSRFFYNNRDSRDRMAEYYVMLYNGGNKRLYLDTLVDTLPKGFTFQSLVAGSAESMNGYTKSTEITVTGTKSQVVQADQDVNYLAAKIIAQTTDEGVNFTILPNGTTDTLHYDAEKQKYYLNRGEAVAFGFVCEIGTTAETEDQATNTVSMAYDDYLGTGVTTIEKLDLDVTVCEGAEPVFSNKNDGTREVQSNTLYSQVIVERGGIIPGVTKFTHERITESGAVPYEGFTNYTDTIRWRVMLHNSGTQSITDYTFQDIMPNPYSFEGDVSLIIYDAREKVMAAEDVILTFPDRVDFAQDASKRETELNITGDDGKTTYTVAFGGMPVKISDTRNITLALERDDAGNEIMTLHLEAPELSIPEGGRVEVWLHSRNPATHTTQVYVNQATLTPNKQPFDSVGHGSMIRNESGEPTSVINSSPVAVTTGVFTTSEKHITEKEDPFNTAVSTDPLNNLIVLDSAEKLITYTLVVKNTTSTMTNLVLIDNLPEVGDYSPFNTAVPRNSEFQVNFAENPNFKLIIDGKEWETDNYSIQYSTTTDFGGPKSADWKGESTGTTAVWTDSRDGARAFRLIVNKEIPESALIQLKFDAVVGADAEPGEIAWNSFGYHYTLQTSENTFVELEAMPLVVGVSIPSVPELEKRIVDSQGKATSAEETVSFSFLIYEGEALTGSYDSVGKLMEALSAENRQYQSVELTVAAGESKSQPVKLDIEHWTWVTGEKYTIVETLDSELYSFNRFLGVNADSYTFTYDPAFTQSIVCENQLEKWEVTLTKVDKVEETKLLPGAVFGLYTPEMADKIQVPEKYQALGIQTELIVDNSTWYLAAVAESDATGTVKFQDLLRQQYYLVELKAPDGYNLPQTGWLLNRSEAESGKYSTTIENTPGYEIPETGGAGTKLYTMGGLLLTVAAMLLLHIHTLKCRKEERTSF